ncbi:MAG: SurA N-terminal domain-containing protein [Candidatus Acetothermia bacterium]
MNISRRTPLIILAISILILSSFAVAAQESSEGAGDSEVATVNGESITQEELTQATQTQQIIMSLSQQYRTFAQFLMTSEAGENFLEEYRKNVLDQLIDQTLAEQKVEEMGITVSEDDVQSEIDSIIEENEQFESEEDLDSYLQENQKSSLDDFRSRIKESLRTEKLREEVTGEIDVTEEEVEEFYEQNKANYTDEEGNEQPLSEVKDQVRSSLESQKQDEAYNEWLEEVREEADISKNL